MQRIHGEIQLLLVAFGRPESAISHATRAASFERIRPIPLRRSDVERWDLVSTEPGSTDADAIRVTLVVYLMNGDGLPGDLHACDGLLRCASDDERPELSVALTRALSARPGNAPPIIETVGAACREEEVEAAIGRLRTRVMEALRDGLLEDYRVHRRARAKHRGDDASFPDSVEAIVARGEDVVPWLLRHHYRWEDRGAPVDGGPGANDAWKDLLAVMAVEVKARSNGLLDLFGEDPFGEMGLDPDELTRAIAVYARLGAPKKAAILRRAAALWASRPGDDTEDLGFEELEASFYAAEDVDDRLRAFVLDAADRFVLPARHASSRPG
jgi:hypothetical protein